jgi:hypothetical protein
MLLHKAALSGPERALDSARCGVFRVVPTDCKCQVLRLWEMHATKNLKIKNIWLMGFEEASTL